MTWDEPAETYANLGWVLEGEGAKAPTVEIGNQDLTTETRRTAKIGDRKNQTLTTDEHG